MDKKIEVWKDIPGYIGSYQASNTGEIKSLSRILFNGKSNFLSKEKILSKVISTTGYYRVSLCLKGKIKVIKVSQLVAMAFHGHVRCGYEVIVDHHDSNRLNDNEENLKLISSRENCHKTKRFKTSKYVGVELNKKSKKWRSHIMINGKVKYLGSFINELDAKICYDNALNSHYEILRNKK